MTKPKTLIQEIEKLTSCNHPEVQIEMISRKDVLALIKAKVKELKKGIKMGITHDMYLDFIDMNIESTLGKEDS